MKWYLSLGLCLVLGCLRFCSITDKVFVLQSINSNSHYIYVTLIVVFIYNAVTQHICIVKGYPKHGIYLFGKIKHTSTDQIKTAFRFWFDATWYIAQMASIKVTLCDVIWCRCGGALCKQTERREKFSSTTECIDIAEFLQGFLA